MIQLSNMLFALVGEYVQWHFFRAPREIILALSYIIHYIFIYFSTVALFKTLFSPWRRYQWQYPRGFDLGKFIEVFASNLISRIIGFLIRVYIIIVGLAGELIVLILAVLAFLFWLILPFLIIGAFFYGLVLLF